MALAQMLGIKGGIAVVLALCCGTLFWLNKDARSDLRQTEAALMVAQASIETLETQLSLLETASLERLQDHDDLSEEEEELEDALEIEDPDARRLAVGCAIMRSQAAAGIRSGVPAECGPADPR